MANGAPVSAVTGTEAVGGTQTQAFGNASTADVNQFADSLKAGGAQGASGSKASGQIKGTFYEKILNPLNEFRANFDKIITNIAGIVGRGNITMADLFQVQFQLTQMAYMNDLSAKTADKLSQGIQTLFRNQG